MSELCDWLPHQEAHHGDGPQECKQPVAPQRKVGADKGDRDDGPDNKRSATGPDGQGDSECGGNNRDPHGTRRCHIATRAGMGWWSPTQGSERDTGESDERYNAGTVVVVIPFGTDNSHRTDNTHGSDHYRCQPRTVVECRGC